MRGTTCCRWITLTKGQWYGALECSLLLAWPGCWISSRVVDLRRLCAHVTSLGWQFDVGRETLFLHPNTYHHQTLCDIGTLFRHPNKSYPLSYIHGEFHHWRVEVVVGVREVAVPLECLRETPLTGLWGREYKWYGERPLNSLYHNHRARWLWYREFNGPKYVPTS